MPSSLKRDEEVCSLCGLKSQLARCEPVVVSCELTVGLSAYPVEVSRRVIDLVR